jgi:hypothetical protein
MADFEIYRSKQNPLHYVAVREGDAGDNARGVRESENLEFMLVVPDDGSPRIAFDPIAAADRISRQGFYAFTVTIEVREHAE